MDKSLVSFCEGLDQKQLPSSIIDLAAKVKRGDAQPGDLHQALLDHIKMLDTMIKGYGDKLCSLSKKKAS